MKKQLLLIILSLSFAGFTNAQTNTDREMRGIWVATTKNVDYPSNKNLSTTQQRKEYIDLLELYKSVGINAIFFQIRPAADAFYASKYEPWSEFLTGKQGKAPSPYYDPLEFMVKEAHKRNIEFHAWFNPFRAVATVGKADVSANHISNRKPEWCFTYGVNKYFDPGIPEVQDYVMKIITDVVERYDIDGVHFDDYFYPYPERGTGKGFIPLPDQKTYHKYGKGFSEIDAWRRDNMDRFIKRANTEIKNIKPTMKFGISPSGIYRNKAKDPDGSNTRGFAHYDYLYTDVLKWLKEEWIDYVAPQIYWNIGHKAADYDELVHWWARHSYNRHLYIGHGVYMISPTATSAAWRNPSELPNQIRMSRKLPQVKGSIFYNTSAFRQNPLGFTDSLRTNFYKHPVLPPTMPWLDSEPPPAPINLTVTKMGRQILLSWDMPKSATGQNKAIYYGVYKFKGTKVGKIKKSTRYQIANKAYISIPRRRFAFFRKKFTFVITSFDKLHNESIPSRKITVKLKK